jgi:hypothetical protein
MLIACPGWSAVRRVVLARFFFFHVALYCFPETGVLQNPSHCVWAHYWHPVVGFRQLVRDVLLPPLWMLASCGNDFLLDLWCGPRMFLWRTAGKLFQSGVSLFLETWLPIVKRAASDMRFPTGLGDVSGSFPGLKQ